MTDDKIKRGCLTCKWADYLKTPTGRLRRGSSFQCQFPEPTKEQMRELLTPLLSDAQLKYLSFLSLHLNHTLWPGDGDDGSDCPKWEPKE